ncbi:pentapeptide repeat-containing protein [Pseudoalteromonas piscicida]|uniref:pentapeptide repeat-containing protein n=1 Tax=Pseudoalteromonas piscicida TaxID=43662 RepID=UPI0005F9EAF7|nr:pentapeptide repeat-containing protein [Pseudoalteromonas piscicida]KJZ03275.1 hypothetical protein TW73_08990 [Pseudoalteromonas piscicida]
MSKGTDTVDIELVEIDGRNTLLGKHAARLWLQGKDAWNAFMEVNPEVTVLFSDGDLNFENLHVAGNNEDVIENLDSIKRIFGFELIDFSGYRFNSDVRFYKLSFNGPVNFGSAVFEGNLEFYQVSFSHDLNISSSTFNNRVCFYSCAFGGCLDASNVLFKSQFELTDSDIAGEVTFDYAVFNKLANFSFAKFEKRASMDSATFEGEAVFTFCIFGSYANFYNTTFFVDADFERAEIKDRIGFKDARFNRNVNFTSATFGDEAFFGYVIFKGNACFNNAIFQRKADFKHTEFKSKASFRSCEFIGNLLFEPNHSVSLTQIDFKGACFEKLFSIKGCYNTIPDLRQTKLNYHLDLSLVEVKLNRKNGYGALFEKAVDRLDCERLCRLKEIAELNKNYERVLAFHADEMRAKRWIRSGVLPSILDGLFSLISNYGQSVLRPFVYLLLSILIFAQVTIISSKADNVEFNDALVVSVATVTPFISISKGARERGIKKFFGSNVPQNYELLSFGHSFASFSFIFLIGLGLRNRFRI